MNEREIRRTLEVLSGNSLIEIRIVQPNKTYSGYFNKHDDVIDSILEYSSIGNVYVVLNTINESCYSREQKDSMKLSKQTTSDADIIRRKWLLIDIDSKRSAGISATEEEKQKSLEVGRKVYTFLRDIGFSEPVSADSGNGLHLLYPINLENTVENTEIIKNVLQVLDLFFSNEHAEIDKVVYNASRITKLYGTTARKGKDTKERPHRESRLISVPETVKPTSVELLKQVSDMLPKPEPARFENNYGRDRFDLQSFISRFGIKVKKEETYQSSKKYVLEHCLFNHEHKGKDACIFELPSGAIGYKCFHNSCSQYRWQDVRKLFEAGAYEQRYKTTSPQKKQVRQLEPKPISEDKGGKFLQLHEIKNIDRSKLIYIKSHFTELDKKMIGFLKGEVSMWSGLNASGKSSILSELALNAINDGFRVAMYSGELTPNKFKNWMQLQAAGRQFTTPTEYQNYYYVKPGIGQKIDRWLEDRFFLYNNQYGSEYNELLAELEELLKTKEIDVLILDNIMSMDLDELAYDNNARQKKAILSICAIAKKHNVHIHIVAHPRKANGFLRKKDISGSSDLSNAVDNVLIIHRVNNDFIREARDYFGEAEASRYYTFDNVVEVCKNRDLGVQDYLVGLYFEIESKRLINERYQNIVYGWQEIEEQRIMELEPIIVNYDMQEAIFNKTGADQFGNKDLPF